MGRELRQNWLYSSVWGLLGTLGKSLHLLVFSDFLPYHKAVLSLTSQCGFEESSNKTVDCEELPEGLPG